MKLINKLWGFRTNNTIKKILAGLYYIFCCKKLALFDIILYINGFRRLRWLKQRKNLKNINCQLSIIKSKKSPLKLVGFFC